jgi:hypothetical protein
VCFTHGCGDSSFKKNLNLLLENPVLAPPRVCQNDKKSPPPSPTPKLGPTEILGTSQGGPLQKQISEEEEGGGKRSRGKRGMEEGGRRRRSKRREGGGGGGRRREGVDGEEKEEEGEEEEEEEEGEGGGEEGGGRPCIVKLEHEHV